MLTTQLQLCFKRPIVMHKKEAGGASATRLDKIFQIGNNFIVFVNDSSQPWKIMLLGYFSLLCHDQKLVTLVGANENFRSNAQFSEPNHSSYIWLQNVRVKLMLLLMMLVLSQLFYFSHLLKGVVNIVPSPALMWQHFFCCNMASLKGKWNTI